MEEESSSEEPDPGEREGGGEAAPFTITNEDDIEFVIEDYEVLDEVALAARHRWWEYMRARRTRAGGGAGR